MVQGESEKVAWDPDGPGAVVEGVVRELFHAVDNLRRDGILVGYPKFIDVEMPQDCENLTLVRCRVPMLPGHQKPEVAAEPKTAAG